MDDTKEAAMITINGRQYTVEQHADSKHVGYLLTGKRGAVYGAMRIKDTDVLFLVSLAGLPRVDPLGPVQLTDRNGTLEVA